VDALAINANRQAPAEAGAPGRSCVALCPAGLRARRLRTARARPGSCLQAVPGAPAPHTRACSRAGPYGPAGGRRAAAHPCAATRSVQPCRASVPGDALQAPSMPYPTTRNRQARRLSLPGTGTAADQAEPAMFETAALLVASARSQLAGQLATPGLCRLSRKAALGASCAAAVRTLGHRQPVIFVSCRAAS
jgi:hypothetical protein